LQGTDNKSAISFLTKPVFVTGHRILYWIFDPEKSLAPTAHGGGMFRHQDEKFSWREANVEASTTNSLVLLHGIGGSSASFDGCAEHLTGPKRRLLAWDMPGYGATARLSKDKPGVDDYVSALWAFLNARRVERFDLAAHSLGSVIAGRIIETAPQRVGRVAFICPLLGMAALPKDRRAAILVCGISPAGAAAPLSAARRLPPSAQNASRS
jgi:pimeloyl-ACP methyl ester carboxylesterase